MIIKCLSKDSPSGATIPDIADEAGATVVSHPSGDCPYYLVDVDPQVVADLGLQADVVDDTAAFFSQYDLTETEETEQEA